MEKKFAVNAYRMFLIWGIFSALGTAVSTLVDAVLIGNYIGSDGLAVTNIATPVFLLFALLSVTTAVGANVLIGQALGKSETEEANKLFHIQLTAGLVETVVCMVTGILGGRKLLYAIGATDTIINLAESYIFIVFLCAGAFIFYYILSYSVRSDGDPKTAAAASVVLIVLNIVLDILFMGIMNFGIKGASLALCISTFCGILVLLTHFMRKHTLLHLGLAVPEKDILIEFVKNGFGTGSAFLFQAVVISVFNRLLVKQSDGVSLVAFYSILYTMSTFAYAVSDDASSALTPVVTIFKGEKDVDSIMKVVYTALKVVMCAGIAISGLYMIFASQIIQLFGVTDSGQIQLFAKGFRIFALSITLTGINAVMTSFWQSLSRAKPAGIMSVLRNFMMMLILGNIFIPRFGTNGLGITYLCCEGTGILFLLYVHIRSNTEEMLKKDCSTVLRSYEKAYVINKDSIAEISSDLEKISEEWEIDFKQAFMINFVIEEVILNIIKFAVDKEKKECSIAIRLVDDQGEYIMRIRDDVADYNPFESDGDEIDHAVLKMIQKKTKYCDYQRKLIFNYLYLIL